MNRLTIIVCFQFLCVVVNAQQQAVVEGRVIDSGSLKPMDGATIELIRLKDSAALSKTITKKGSFRFNKVSLNDSLMIQISYAGYSPFNGLLVVKEKYFLMQPVYMLPEAKMLGEIVVKSAPRLMVIKKDTTEFNAGAIQTPPNAVAEDLLKKIPGLLIDGSGQLLFNGRPVSRILVDGRVFFAADGKIALSNIPVDLIKKIQFYTDSTNEQELFNGSAGNHPHTLNIKLKAGNKYFGNLQAGYGTNDRYAVSGLATRIRDKENISLFGGSNNINVAGLLPPTGVNLNALTSGGGITKKLSGGLNYNTVIRNKTKVAAKYDFGHPVTYNEILNQKRENILADSVISSTSVQQFENNSYSNDVGVWIQKGEATSLSVNFLNRHSANHAIDNSSTGRADGSFINRLQGESKGVANENGGSVGIGFLKNFSPKSRIYFLLKGSLDQQLSENQNQAKTLFYKNNLPDSQALQLQYIEQQGISSGLNFFSIYKLRFSNFFEVKVSDNFITNWRQAKRTTWHTDSSGAKTGIDSLLSNDFASKVVTNHINTQLAFKKGKWFATLDIGMRYNSYHNFDKTRDTSIRIEQANWFPKLRMERIDLKTGTFLLLMEMDATEPTIDQLQPVTDNTNPLNIIKGNPDLRSAIHYKTGVRYNKKISTKNSSSFTASLNYNPVINKIITSVSYDSLGKRVTQFVNLNGTYVVNAAINFSFRFTRSKNVWTLTTNSSVGRTHDLIYLNGKLNASDRYSFGSSFNVDYGYADLFNLRINYTPSYTHLRYEQNGNADRHYWLQNVNTFIDIYAFKRIRLRNNILYTYNNNLPAEFVRSAIFWNASISYLCFRNKKGEIRLSAFDILRQNRNINRIVNDNYIEDSQSNNLQQYLMLGFVWNFSGLNK